MVGQGWCRKHYMRVRRWGTPEDIDHRSTKPRATCTVGDCGKPAVGKGLCNNHWKASRRVPKIPIVCPVCKQEFVPLKSTRVFCSRRCKDLDRTRSGRAARDVRKSILKVKYGLTPEEMDRVTKEGSCEICGTREWGGRHGVPHVDHCHATGAVRGFLCNDCNHGLGRFHDDPQRMEAAAAYVRSHQERIGRGESHVIPVRPYWE